MDRNDTPPPEASASVVAQSLREALKAAGYRLPRDLTVKRERGGVANHVFVYLKRLGIVLSEVQTIADRFQRVHLDEKDRPRIDKRHLYVRVEYLPEVLEPFRREARHVLQALTAMGSRVQVARYWVSISHAGYHIESVNVRRPRKPIVCKAIDEAAAALALLVASDGHTSMQARLP
jgi:hypothetical protein